MLMSSIVFALMSVVTSTGSVAIRFAPRDLQSSVSIYHDVVTRMPDLSDEELDLKLEEAVIDSEKAEMLVCCYLSEVRERRLFVAFGYANISDYAFARFGFRARKTHYLVRLGQRIKRLPKLREAMANGKIGWCKASRIAAVAAPEDEVTWIESALSSSAQQLEKKSKTERTRSRRCFTSRCLQGCEGCGRTRSRFSAAGRAPRYRPLLSSSTCSPRTSRNGAITSPLTKLRKRPKMRTPQLPRKTTRLTPTRPRKARPKRVPSSPELKVSIPTQSCNRAYSKAGPWPRQITRAIWNTNGCAISSWKGTAGNARFPIAVPARN